MCDLNNVAKMASKAGYAVMLDSNVDALRITNDDGIHVVLVIQDHEILMESVIAPAARVNDVIAFNAAVLRSHHRLFPMAAIAINAINGEDFYVAFSVLPVIAKDETIQDTLDNLFEGVADMAQVFGEYFN